MPVTYRFEPEANLTIVTMSGPVGFDDLAGAFLERLGHPDHRPGMNILLDGRDAVLEFSADDIRRLVLLFEQKRDERGAGIRFAMASHQDLTFALGRMYEAYAVRLPEQVRVFRDFDDAMRWVTSSGQPGAGAAHDPSG